MSIEHLNAAFQSSVKPSARKFVLVALADYANETGLAYPSIETLSNKTGQDRKTVRQHLIALSEQGILSDTGERVGKTKQIPKYQINIQRLPKLVLLKTPKNGRVKATKNGTLKDSQKRYTEPSVSFNHQKEPPVEGIPIQKIVNLYHDKLPCMPRIKIITPARKQHFRARWNQSEEYQTIEYWAGLFDFMAESDFLNGKIPGKNGGRPFKASFDWMINPNNFAKIIEGNYENEAA